MLELNKTKHGELLEQIEVLIQCVVRHKNFGWENSIDMYWYIEKRTELELIKERFDDLHKKIEILYQRYDQTFETVNSKLATDRDYLTNKFSEDKL
jgi:hypothetical protein